MNKAVTICSDASISALRDDVRAFLRAEMKGMSDRQRAESWQGFDRGFTQAVAKRGWIGMTWPVEYGGGGRPWQERYVIQEEMLAAGAPVAAHWVAERQSGPLLLRVGTEEQKRAYMPGIVAGDLVFCIGMSEPEAGSDLAAIRTRAERTATGWRMNGQKLWTTHAAKADVMITLARTAPVDTEHRHAGMSQFLIELRAPGVTIKPIRDMAGSEHFNEILLDDVILEPSALLGEEGAGWKQVMAELALERSGPERFLSSLPLLSRFAQDHDRDDSASTEYLGRAFADLLSLREMSLGVMEAFADHQDPSVEASLVKYLGAGFEQDVVSRIADLIGWDGSAPTNDNGASALLARLSLTAPSFSLRGGTTEILRSIIAKEITR